MSTKLRVSLAAFLIVLSIFVASQPARAQTGDFRIGPSGAQVAGVGVAVGAAVGVGIYFIARSPRISGCVISSAAGLEFQADADHQIYTLTADSVILGSFKPGDRIRIIGRKKTTAGGVRSIVAKKLLKDYGSCKVAPSASPQTTGS
jgi:hypothetical protein